MSNKSPQRDPIGIYRRETAASRRLGEITQCACGESRLAALNTRTKPISCEECKRKRSGKTIMDKHHVPGKANSPITVPVPANDHRVLSAEQYDWHTKTLSNPDGSPLLAAAACIRGFKDFVLYLIDKFLDWIGDMLEVAHECLEKKLGPKWWEKTELKKFQPGEKSHAEK